MISREMKNAGREKGRGGKKKEKEKKIIQFESFTKQKKLSLQTDMPPTVNGNGKKKQRFHLHFLEGYRKWLPKCVLTPQDAKNSTVPLTEISRSAGIYSVGTNSSINLIGTGYSDPQWLKISEAE